MNINTNSWHYRLVKNVTFRDSHRGHVPTSLCPYFRAVMYRVLFFTVVISGVVIMLGAMGNPIGISMMAFVGATGLVAKIGAAVAGFFAMTGIFATLIGVAVAGGFGIAKISEKIGEIRRERNYAKYKQELEDIKNGIEPPAPGLLKAWFTAKHDAVCPTLEFVTPEETTKKVEE